MNSPGVPRSANRHPETGQQRILLGVKLANYHTTRSTPAFGANGIGASMKEFSRRVQRTRGRDRISPTGGLLCPFRPITQRLRMLSVRSELMQQEREQNSTAWEPSKCPPIGTGGAQTQRSLQYFSIALASGKVTVEQFDSIVEPTNMVGDGIAGA
jgi:hypothetical protein